MMPWDLLWLMVPLGVLLVLVVMVMAVINDGTGLRRL